MLFLTSWLVLADFESSPVWMDSYHFITNQWVTSGLIKGVWVNIHESKEDITVYIQTKSTCIFTNAPFIRHHVTSWTKTGEVPVHLDWRWGELILVGILKWFCCKIGVSIHLFNLLWSFVRFSLHGLLKQLI